MMLPSQSCISETCMIRPNLLGLLGNTHIISPFAPKTSLLYLPHGECHPVGLRTHANRNPPVLRKHPYICHMVRLTC